MSNIGRLHDASSRVLFGLAGGALVIALALQLFEVVARYFFDSPTTWSGEAVQYALAMVIFLSLPEVTRRKAHIVIDIVPGLLRDRAEVWLGRVNAVVAVSACGASAWIIAMEAMKQFERNVMTNAANPVPRWWITAVIALGFASAAGHFLRQLSKPST